MKKTLPKDKNIAFVYVIRKTIMRVFNFMFSVECSFLSDIHAPKKKDCPKTVFPKYEENLRITTGVAIRGLPRE
ncbi:hypothetical protein SAMN05444377_11643 [Flavobacterium fontis]|uniref:Uncharacterized protein n=1 Tax=Flavobacterium fontis TaxID=1124188 RepID=A0A1M5DTE5_9FLAO|nr:hypothetical protein SAMN05444377_11643 [Flavobacterium fontis]